MAVGWTMFCLAAAAIACARDRTPAPPWLFGKIVFGIWARVESRAVRAAGFVKLVCRITQSLTCLAHDFNAQTVAFANNFGNPEEKCPVGIVRPWSNSLLVNDCHENCYLAIVEGLRTLKKAHSTTTAVALKQAKTLTCALRRQINCQDKHGYHKNA